MDPRMFMAAIALASTTVAIAADQRPYPVRPIHLVIGLPAGGGADAIGRILAAGLGDALGQTVVVENRPGANNLIAAEAVARAAPDGYTLLFAGVTVSALLPALGVKLSSDPMTDLAPVSLVGTVPMVLVVGKKMPVKTLDDLLDFAKSHDGEVNYASSGNGSPLHLSMEMLKSRTGMHATHVPYKGSVQAASDLLSGQVHVMFDILPNHLGNIKAGKVRVLAVASARRHPEIPDVPTMSEAGVPGFDSAIWYAVFAPSRTPPQIIEELNRGLGKAVRSAHFRDGIQPLGAEAVPSTPQEALRLRKSEVAKWTTVIQRAGIHLDKSGS